MPLHKGTEYVEVVCVRGWGWGWGSAGVKDEWSVTCLTGGAATS